MSKRHRSFLLASLLPAFLLVSVFGVVHAQEGKSPAARQARWSDPATWPARHVPRAGDKVTIAADKDVVLDVSPPALSGLTIDGKLSFANNADLELTTEWRRTCGCSGESRQLEDHPRAAIHFRQREGHGRPFGRYLDLGTGAHVGGPGYGELLAVVAENDRRLQDSLEALRKASDTSYYKGPDSLWVKVISTGDAGNGAPGGGTSLQVGR